MQSGRPPLAAHSHRQLIDYITLINVFQGCADLAPANSTAPLNLVPSAPRCVDLHAKELIAATTLPEQATEAQKIMNDFGILPEQNLVRPGTGSPLCLAGNYRHLCQCLWPLQRDRQSVQLQLRRHNGGRSGTARARRESRESLAPATASRRRPASTSSTMRPQAAPRRTASPRRSKSRRRALPALAQQPERTPRPGRRSPGQQGDQARRIDKGGEDIIASRQSASHSRGVRHRPERRHPSPNSPARPVRYPTTWSRDRSALQSTK